MTLFYVGMFILFCILIARFVLFACRLFGYVKAHLHKPEKPGEFERWMKRQRR